jgi:hypothetical protein
MAGPNRLRPVEVLSLTESNYLARFLSNHDAASRR